MVRPDAPKFLFSRNSTAIQLLFHYDTKLPDAAPAVQGYRVCSGIVVGILFAVCTVLLMIYQLNKKTTIQMADELEERRATIATL